ncbi:MAG: killer suppression protein [bacterium]|nr:killer suppression protein [bacterium]MCY3651833.1 killer suppression protein [bacterium]MDE0642722.1 killer suppression protein [bacterium]MYD04847.1 killer suppression protein [Acidimicrobiia bacterium]MYH55006.1 killer suppression protein [Acidimicrobiia bacterium]
MKLNFESPRFGSLCINQKLLVRKYGRPVADKVESRLSHLLSAATLEEMRHLPGGCHELKGNRNGQLAVTLHGGYRLIFRPGGSPVEGDAGLDWSSVNNRDGDCGLPLAVVH